MRITITIDDDLFERAQHITGITGRSALVQEALHAIIQRESARRLARMGVTEPNIKPIPRRRGEPSSE